MIQVHTSGDPLVEAAQALRESVKKHEGKDVLLLFSGGSALALLDHVHPRIISSHHTLSVLDERYTFDEEESNFSKLCCTNFYKESQVRHATFIDPRPREHESLEETAKRFDLALKHWHVLHREGVVIVTVGIGPDGHTAGILPMPEKKTTFEKLFFSTESCAVGYETTPEKNPHTKRITVTGTYLLRHVDHAIIYATGRPKREVLQRILISDDDRAELPSVILNKVTDAHLYTDMSL